MRIQTQDLGTFYVEGLTAQEREPGFNWVGLQAGSLSFGPQTNLKGTSFFGFQGGRVFDHQGFGLSFEAVVSHPKSDLLPGTNLTYSAQSITLQTGFFNSPASRFWPYFGQGLGTLSVPKLSATPLEQKTVRASEVHVSLGFLHRPGEGFIWGMEGRYAFAFGMSDPNVRESRGSLMAGLTWGGRPKAQRTRAGLPQQAGTSAPAAAPAIRPEFLLQPPSLQDQPPSPAPRPSAGAATSVEVVPPPAAPLPPSASSAPPKPIPEQVAPPPTPRPMVTTPLPSARPAPSEGSPASPVAAAPAEATPDQSGQVPATGPAIPAPTPTPTIRILPPPSPRPPVAIDPVPAAISPRGRPAPTTADASRNDPARAQRLDALRQGDLARAVELGRKHIEALPAHRWTVRLEIASLPSTLKNALEAFPGVAPDLYIAPIALRGGKAAYQLFLGDYPSKAEADKAATNVPGFFLEEGQRPMVLPVARVLKGAAMPTSGGAPPPFSTAPAAPAPASQPKIPVAQAPSQDSELVRRREALRRGDLDQAVELGNSHIEAMAPRRWTLHLETAARPSTLKRAVEAFPDGKADLFVVPTRLPSGRPAYQLFLGDYASREEAEQAALAVPQVFLQGGQGPRAVPLSKVARKAPAPARADAQISPPASPSLPTAEMTTRPALAQGPIKLPGVDGGGTRAAGWMPWIVLLLVLLVLGSAARRLMRRKDSAAAKDPHHGSDPAGPG